MNVSLLNVFKKKSGEGSSEKKKSEKKDKTKSSGKKKGKPVKYQKKSPLSYTAREPFVDSLFGQEGFTHEYEGETYGVVLILPFEAMGGLTTSKEDKNNQNKGRFVSAVNTGEISVYYDEATDEAEELIVLVNTENIDNLYDFSILKDADFTWAYFPKEETDAIVRTEYVSTIEELHDRRSDLNEYFKSIFDLMAEDEANENADKPADDKSSEDDELSGLSGLSSGAESNAESAKPVIEVENADDDLNNAFAEPDFSVNKKASFGELMSGGMTATNVEDSEDKPFEVEVVKTDASDEYDDSAYDEDLMLNEESVDESAVDAVVEQILFRDDLDLVVPVNRFREVYFKDASRYYIPYYEKDGNWLTDEVNRLIKVANNEIKQRIISDDDEIHNHFNRLLTDLAVKTSTDFSLESKHYAGLLEDALDVKRRNKTALDADVEEHNRKAEEAYAEARENKGNEAKTNAMNAFDNQNKDKHLRQMSEYKSIKEKEAESRYNDDVIAIKDRRKQDAKHYFELGSAKIMSELGRRYTDVRDGQTAFVNEWNDRISKFLDENRANDVARIEVMKRQQESDERFAQLELEAKTNIERLTEEFESRVKLAQTDFDMNAKRLEDQVALLTAERDRLLENYTTLEQRAITDYDELSARFHAVNKELIDAKSKANLVDMQVAQLGQREREVEDWKTQVDIVSKANERNKIAFVCLASLAIVGALLMGMIFGAQFF